MAGMAHVCCGKLCVILLHAPTTHSTGCLSPIHIFTTSHVPEGFR
jgi:hypothetical protein